MEVESIRIPQEVSGVIALKMKDKLGGVHGEESKSWRAGFGMWESKMNEILERSSGSKVAY